MTSKEQMVIRRPPNFEILDLVKVLESYNKIFTGKMNTNRLYLDSLLNWQIPLRFVLILTPDKSKL